MVALAVVVAQSAVLVSQGVVVAQTPCKVVAQAPLKVVAQAPCKVVAQAVLVA